MSQFFSLCPRKRRAEMEMKMSMPFVYFERLMAHCANLREMGKPLDLNTPVVKQFQDFLRRFVCDIRTELTKGEIVMYYRKWQEYIRDFIKQNHTAFMTGNGINEKGAWQVVDVFIVFQDVGIMLD